MVSFYVNGNRVSGPEEMDLLTYLREVAGLTSVKNGCAKGACGACTVLIDGRAGRACVQRLSGIRDKHVQTVEGLSDREKEVYAYSFGKAGAVQCGFCTPGMVMSAKALLDRSPDPTLDDVKKAIRGNLCRCTGYKKIEQAILLAARIFQGKASMEEGEPFGRVGDSLVRVDAADKVLGRARYCDDVVMENMLHVKVLRTRYPRARILKIDTTRAEQCCGVVKVLTAKDIPGENLDGYVVHDWPTMIPEGGCTHYIGDALAVVAAETVLQAELALKEIEVTYQPLPALTDPLVNMQENACAVHEDRPNILAHVFISRNDPDAALAQAAHTVTRTFRLPFTDHAFLEPESTVAFYEGDVLNVYSATQNIYSDHGALCRILNLQPEQVRVRSLHVGGGFGGKEDMILQHHAALVTYYTKRPAKLTFTREESLLVHPKRHAMRITLTLGADEEGNFTALRSRIIADTGAYASMGAGVLRRACTHSCGPYRMPAIELDGYAVYTNHPPAGAFRGFGVTQSAYALEQVVDQLAEELGMDRWALRRKNALCPGDEMGPGQICGPDTAIVETLEAVKPYYDRAIARGEPVGIACGIKNTGMGGGKADIGRARLEVEEGTVVLFTSAQCIGQGLATAMTQIIAQTADIPAANIRCVSPDTACTPNSNATTASRQTLVTGEAVRRAAEALRRALADHSLAQLNGRTFTGEYQSYTEKLNDPEHAHPRNHEAYSYATDLVVLAPDGRVKTVVAAHDVGRAVNPQMVEGQIEGGVTMGLGYALRETFPLEEGYVKAAFGRLGLLRADEVPEIIPIIIEKPGLAAAYGAKGIGEISAIPAAPAAASAYRSLDGAERLCLPLEGTPYRN